MPPSHVSGGGLETEDKMNDGVMNLKQQIVGLQNDYDLPVVCVLILQCNETNINWEHIQHGERVMDWS